MERITDFRIDFVEIQLADFQRLSVQQQQDIEAYGTWVTSPNEAVLTGNPIQFEMPIYRWQDIGLARPESLLPKGNIAQ